MELMFDKMAFYFSKASDFRNIPISVSCGTVGKFLFAIAERMVNSSHKNNIFRGGNNYNSLR